MLEQSPRRNAFRAAVVRGERKPLVVEEKQPRLERSEADSLGLLIPRTEARHGDHRDGDRHRLNGEVTRARYRGRSYEAELVNLSSGGAMVKADFVPRLWDMVELELGDGLALEAAVRWVKKGLVGLEFAHETRIECDPETRAKLLLDVIQRSFPESEIALAPVADEADGRPAPSDDFGAQKRSELRHPLVWSGQILFAFDSNPARLRNISCGGALVDICVTYPVGAEVVLDLHESGQINAVVTRVHGDQAGLRFTEPFDLARLARTKPALTAEKWQRPEFLEKMTGDCSPWDDQWGRGSLHALRSELEGFLKR